MDEAKRNQIEQRVIDCEMKIANEQAKLIRYQAQLKNGKTAQTRSKPTVNKQQTGSKSVPKQGQTSTNNEKEKGFFETIFS
jgi:hypothetical protein